MFFQIVADPQGPTNPPVIGRFQRLQGGCQTRWWQKSLELILELLLVKCTISSFWMSKSTSKLLQIMFFNRWKAQTQSNSPSSQRVSLFSLWVSEKHSRFPSGLISSRNRAGKSIRSSWRQLETSIDDVSWTKLGKPNRHWLLFAGSTSLTPPHFSYMISA